MASLKPSPSPSSSSLSYNAYTLYTSFPNSRILKLSSPSTHFLQITKVSAQDPFPLETLRPALERPIGKSTSRPASSRPSSQDQVLVKTQMRNGTKQPFRGEVKMGSASKNSIWQNPKSRRATQLPKDSYEARYSCLVSIAKLLSSCTSKDDTALRILVDLKGQIVEQDAVIIINHLTKLDIALLALTFFQRIFKMAKEVIFYNVTMKVCRNCRNLGTAEKLFDDMLKRGLKPDNVTFSTLISCAGGCRKPDKAVEWFEKMPDFGCDPDHVTYSAIIDACGRCGNFIKALSLYAQAKAKKLHIDIVAFSMVIKIYGITRNFDACLNAYEEMKALRIKPNLVIYNTLLDAMGKAKLPWQAKTIFKEMTDNVVSPNQATYAALIRAYGRCHFGEDALVVYRDMKQKGVRLNMHLYNTLLTMCGELGYSDEAAEIFEDMQNSGDWKPDRWTYSCMISVYACSGRISEAYMLLRQMVAAGVAPSVYFLTSLIQGLGKANRTDDVVRTFERLIKLGITIDDKFCGCLLNVMAQTPREGLAKLVGCAKKLNYKLGYVTNFLVEELDGEVKFKERVFDLLNSVGYDLKKAYCNSLIDICVNLNLLGRASGLLELGLKLGLYKGLQHKSPAGWYLDLKDLSVGAAQTALRVWVDDLSKTLESGQGLPSLLGIHVGRSKCRYAVKELDSVVKSCLKELNAPFHEASSVCWFFSSSISAKLWLESRRRSLYLVAA